MKAFLLCATLTVACGSAFAQQQQYLAYPYKQPGTQANTAAPTYTAVGVPNAPSPEAPTPTAPSPSAPDPKAPDWSVPQSQPMTPAQQAMQQAQGHIDPVVNAQDPAKQQPAVSSPSTGSPVPVVTTPAPAVIVHHTANPNTPVVVHRVASPTAMVAPTPALSDHAAGIIHRAISSPKSSPPSDPEEAAVRAKMFAK